MGDCEFMPPQIAKSGDQSKTGFPGVGADKGVESAARSVSRSFAYTGCERLLLGFSAHTLAEQIKMYHEDGVRGVFLAGIAEQVDYYLSMKMYDDASIDVDELLNEFFSRYFGSASVPMKKFYLRIEEIYGDPSNYVGTKLRENMHQTEKVAWSCLGTEKRMKELGALIDQALQFAATDIEKKRVQLWKEGVWDYMVEGRKKYRAKLK